MNILEISKSSSAKTEFSFFFGIFSSAFGFFNTDVGVGFGILNIAISVSVFGYRLGSRLPGAGVTAVVIPWDLTDCVSENNIHLFL